MSPETLPTQNFNFNNEENKILEGTEPGLVSILNLMARRPLTEKPQ